MQIDIHARHTPASIPVTVMVCDIENGDAVSDMLASHVNMTVAGEKVELQGLITLNVPYMVEVTVSSEFGYVLENVNAGNNFIQEADGEYTFFAGEPCTLTLSMREIVAPEGYALVKFIKNDNRIGFYPYNADLEREDGAYSVDQPGVVKIGNYVCVAKFSYDFPFESITVNGESIEIIDSQEAYQEYFIKIEEDCTIEARLYDPNEGTCPITCWDMNDGTFGITIVDLYINDNGTLTKHYNAAPGETIEFVIPYVAPGFELKYISGKNDNSPNLTDIASFTFTVPDELNNPVSGDVYRYVFEPVCEINAAEPPYVLEFYPTYEDFDTGREVIGYVVGIDPYFNRETTFMFATEGTEVTVLAYERDDYELVRLFTNTERTITSPYTVSVEDAYDFHGYNKINIGAEYKLRELSSVEEITATESVRYNAAVQTVTGIGSIKVMNINGILVASGENTVNVETLPAGIYVASDGNTTVKFVKK